MTRSGRLLGLADAEKGLDGDAEELGDAREEMAGRPAALALVVRHHPLGGAEELGELRLGVAAGLAQAREPLDVDPRTLRNNALFFGVSAGVLGAAGATTLGVAIAQQQFIRAATAQTAPGRVRDAALLARNLYPVSATLLGAALGSALFSVAQLQQSNAGAVTVAPAPGGVVVTGVLQ